MELLNKTEHLHCKDYADENSRIFKIHKFKKGECLEKKSVDADYILFLIKGAIDVYWITMPKSVVSEGSMALFKKNTCIYGEVLEDCTIISCRINEITCFCNRYDLSKLRTDFRRPESIRGGGNFLDNQYVRILSVKPCIHEFLSMLEHHLEDGLDCTHYHNIKQTELFIYFRAYYSKNELWSFFKDVIPYDICFRELVENNYSKVKNVEEFAALANMTISTFQRKFKKEFHKSVGEWIADKKAEQLLLLLKGTEVSFSEISDLLKFSSLSHMGTFCKNRWGASPRMIRYRCNGGFAEYSASAYIYASGKQDEKELRVG